MKKSFVLQKIVFILFILFAVVSILFALGFMTNYQDFQYLFDVRNQPLYDFHHNVLIPFNNFIFYASVIGIIMIIVIFIAKINKQIPKLYNLCLGVVAIIPLLVTAIYGLTKLPEIKSIYLCLDFSYVAEEIYAEYIPSTLAFDLGNIFYIISLAFIAIYLAVLISNYFIRRNRENV